ncbi:MAG: hypothetical protein NZ730_09765 [Porticoccaceae bacterium]|nr:hypothetical protein [Porticoccaceae bacterium]
MSNKDYGSFFIEGEEIVTDYNYLIEAIGHSDWYVDGDVIINSGKTFLEIQAETTRLQDEYNSVQYQRDRIEAYPSIEDQLDDLYHNGYDGWKDTITAIKIKHPK